LALPLRAGLCWLIALAVVFTATDAHADARSKARRNFTEALAALEAKDYERAITAFEKANEAVPHPDVQYNLARACADAGRFEEAIYWFEVYLEQPVTPADVESVRSAIRTLRSRIEAPLVIGKPTKPAEAPEDGDTTAPAVPTVPTPVPETTKADVDRLLETAADVRPLSPDRAKELEAIAARLIALAAAPPPAPTVEADPDAVAESDYEIDADPAVAEAATPLELPTAEPREVEDYEEREVVVAATGEAAKPQDAPAVVWVITQREIRNRGYESIADALRAVAGLHVIDDFVFVDVGVRGLHGGLRGMSRLIKVLVNGQPVSFRPNSGNFLGPEMIPIRAVDRIELIRGPASALYGANAFLGVLQIVTRRGGDIRGGSIAGRFGANTSADGTPLSGGGDVVVGTKTGDLSILLTAQAVAQDRSGLSLPESSPLFDGIKADRGVISKDDRSSPMSAFGSINYDLHSAGVITLEGGYQRLSSRAEWLDFGPLTHFNRIVLQNFWARLAYDVPLSESVGLNLFASYTEGGPGDGHRIRAQRTGAVAPSNQTHLEERFGSRAVFAGTEVKWDFSEQFAMRVGADLDVDFQDLLSVDLVFDDPLGVRRAGDTVPQPDSQQGTRTFINAGGYLQLASQPIDEIDLVGGVRYDYHDLYESSVNGRVGTVFRIYEGVFLKAMYGSSFRAPAPDQLFHGAAYLGDTIGCQNYPPCESAGLQPQTAHTGEFVIGYDGGDTVTAQLIGYLSFVDDLIISFPNQGGFFVTTNAGSYLSKGIELELEASKTGIGGVIDLGGHFYLSFEDTEPDIPESQFDPPESIRDEFRQSSLFPAFTAGGGIDFGIPAAKLGLYIEGRYVGPRRASGSNLVLGNAGYESDELPGYFELDMNLSTRDLYLFGDGETVISLRLTDLIGDAHAEGGFRGWDVPTLGRQVFVRVIQEF